MICVDVKSNVSECYSGFINMSLPGAASKLEAEKEKKKNLMDDSRAWFPEAHSIFCCSAGQEVVDFVVDFLEMGSINIRHVKKSITTYLLRDQTYEISNLRSGQILHSSDLRLNQVIAVNGGGHRHPGQAAADELEHCHLGRGVLHGHAVGMKSQVSATAVDLLVVGVIEVAVHDFL